MLKKATHLGKRQHIISHLWNRKPGNFIGGSSRGGARHGGEAGRGRARRGADTTARLGEKNILRTSQGIEETYSVRLYRSTIK